MKKQQISNWEDVRAGLARVVFRLGVTRVAEIIPADRATVYRLIGRQTHKPSLAVRARVVEIVKEQANEVSK